MRTAACQAGTLPILRSFRATLPLAPRSMAFVRLRGFLSAAGPATPRRLAIPIALFLLALVPRLHDLGSPSLSTDEVKWIRRGERMVGLLRAGELRRATAHLSHPGIPPALMIGLSQRWAWRFDARFDPVVAARLPNAVVGASLSPLLYAASTPLWGAPVAGLAAVVIALDPRHLAASRSAHLDVVFGLFYGLGLWAFFRRREEPSPRHGALGAGALMLAEATRTSGVLCALTVVATSVVERVRRRRAPIDSAELAWVAAGALGFVVLFGKLWLEPAAIPAAERYPLIHAVESGLAAVASHSVLVAVLGLVAIASGAWLRGLPGLLLGLLGLALAAAALEPDLVRNVAGFAKNLWTSPERLHHRYYGDTGEPIPGKYWTVLAEGMPAPVLLPLVLGFPFFAWSSWRDDTARGRAGVAVTIAVGVFFAVAIQLDKVAFRYLVPMQPFLALVAAWSIVSALRFASERAASGALPALAATAGLGALVLPGAPYYSAWESVIGERLRRELGFRPLLAQEGHDAAAHYLWRHAGPETHVSTFCYDDVLRYYWHEVLPRREGEGPKPLPKLGFYRLEDADLLVLSIRRRPHLPRTFDRLVTEDAPVVRVEVDGAVALEVFDVAAWRARERSS